MNSFVDGVIDGSNIPFVVSGNADNLEALEDYPALIKISSPDDFIEQLDHYYQSTDSADAETVGRDNV